MMSIKHQSIQGIPPITTHLPTAMASASPLLTTESIDELMSLVPDFQSLRDQTTRLTEILKASTYLCIFIHTTERWFQGSKFKTTKGMLGLVISAVAIQVRLFGVTEHVRSLVTGFLQFVYLNILCYLNPISSPEHSVQ
jgi:hypothetical protein